MMTSWISTPPDTAYSVRATPTLLLLVLGSEYTPAVLYPPTYSRDKGTEEWISTGHLSQDISWRSS